MQDEGERVCRKRPRGTLAGEEKDGQDSQASKVNGLSIALFVVATASSAVAQPALPTCKESESASGTAPAEAKPRTYQEYWCDVILRIDRLPRGPAGTGPQSGVPGQIGNAVDVGSGNWGAFLLYAQARSSAVDAEPGNKPKDVEKFQDALLELGYRAAQARGRTRRRCRSSAFTWRGAARP
jgi:hypothetical protein